MSTQYSQHINVIKKIKLDEVHKNVSSIAEYKRCAILKFCIEYGIKSYQLDKLSISNDLHNIGLFYVLY